MLLQFSGGNYGPFRERAVLSMVGGEVDKRRDEGNEDRGFSWETEEDGLRVMRCAAVYGANCSGKSSLIRAMYDARRMIVSPHFTEREVRGRPFRKESCKELPSHFSFNFLARGDNYIYSFALSPEGVVVSEKLTLAISEEEEDVLFWREEGEQEYRGTMFDPQAQEFGDPLLIAKHRRPDQLLLPKLKEYLKWGNPVEAPFFWFKDRLRVLRGGWSVPREGAEYAAWHWERNKPTDYLNNDESFREFASKFLKRVGVVLEEVRTEKFVFFPGLDEESDSVHRLLRFAYELYKQRGRDCVLVVDDFDLGLHPSLTRYLLREIMGSGKEESQLIFTTHNPLLISPNWDDEGLPRESVWFVDINEPGEASLYPLTSFESEQTDKLEKENLWRDYLIGRFGGVPFLPSVSMQRHAWKEQ